MSLNIDFDETLAFLDEIDSYPLFVGNSIESIECINDIENDTTLFEVFEHDNTSAFLSSHTDCESDDQYKDNLHVQSIKKEIKAQKKQINTSRERQKQELIDLRVQVTKLESKIKKLNAYNAEDKNMSNCSYSSVNVAWKSLAMSEMKACARSKLENEKLRIILNDQLSIAQSIERALSKQSKTELVNLNDTTEFEKRHKLFYDSTDYFKRERFFQCMDGRALKADELIIQIESIVQPHDTQCTTAEIIENNGLYAELYERQPLPFSHTHVFKVIWEFFSLKSLKITSGEYKAVEITHNTIIAEMNVNISTAYHQYQGKEKIIIRRHDQDHQSVVIVEALCILPDYEIQTSSEIIIKEDDDQVYSSTAQSCILLDRIKMRINQCANSVSYVDLLLSTFKRSIHEFHLHLESMLLQKKVKQEV